MFIAKCFYLCVCSCVHRKGQEEQQTREKESWLLSLGRVRSRCFWNKCVQVCANVRVWPLKSAECLCVCVSVSVCQRGYFCSSSHRLKHTSGTLQSGGLCSHTHAVLFRSVLSWFQLISPLKVKSIKSPLLYSSVTMVTHCMHANLSLPVQSLLSEAWNQVCSCVLWKMLHWTLLEQTK